MTTSSRCLRFLLAALLLAEVTSFVTPRQAGAMRPHSFVVLQAKKKNNKKGSGGQGFGQAPVQEEQKPMAIEEATADIDGASFLKSVPGGSNVIPQFVDESVPVEQRTRSLLRDKYGLRTREEQDEEERKQEAIKEQRKKLDKWQDKADKGQDFDLMSVLPPPVLIFIDGFLKVGLSICTVLFLLAGVLITAEAWSKASDSPLPEDIDNFIVNVVEPNFTPGLGVLLGFSISLGAFAAAQLTSSSSTYREDS
jgi:hypothetical protein